MDAMDVMDCIRWGDPISLPLLSIMSISFIRPSSPFRPFFLPRHASRISRHGVFLQISADDVVGGLLQLFDAAEAAGLDGLAYDKLH